MNPVDPSPDHAFKQLVAEMRDAQRRYFRTRSAGDLEVSKAKEREVDQALRDLDEQPRLF